MNATDAIASHFASWHAVITEAIREALKKNDGKSTLLGVPLALAPRLANDFARTHRFSLWTVEQVLSERTAEIEQGGLLVSDYYPACLNERENERFIARLRVHSANNVVLLFVLLTQDMPAPDPATLRSAWMTGLFRWGELYEVSTSWSEVTLSRLKAVILPFWKGWRRTTDALMG